MTLANTVNAWIVPQLELGSQNAFEHSWEVRVDLLIPNADDMIPICRDVLVAKGVLVGLMFMHAAVDFNDQIA